MHDSLERKVNKKVKAKKGFFIHLGIYLAVGIFFFLINLATFSDGDSEVWFFYPMLPWFVGIAAHYLAVFGFPGVNRMEERWEREELEKELMRMRGKYEGIDALPPPEDEPIDLEEQLQLKKLKKQRDKLYEDDELV